MVWVFSASQELLATAQGQHARSHSRLGLLQGTYSEEEQEGLPPAVGQQAGCKGAVASQGRKDAAGACPVGHVVETGVRKLGGVWKEQGRRRQLGTGAGTA